MMTLIYKKKMDYFKSGGDDWKEVRSLTMNQSCQKTLGSLKSFRKYYDLINCASKFISQFRNFISTLTDSRKKLPERATKG